MKSFEDINIKGIDKNKINKPDPTKELYNVYFKISAKPPPEWISIFKNERVLQHSMSRKIWVENDYIVLYCPLDEIKRIHLRKIRQAINSANKEYKEYLKKREAKKEKGLLKEQEEQKKINETLKELDIDIIE